MDSRISRLQAALPAEGLLEGQFWRWSPQAYPLTSEQMEALDQLGRRLWALVKACNLLYRLSVEGRAPEWIARWLDAGKPPALVTAARHKALKNQLPRVLRPDLILTESGWVMTELDSLPGGIGLTAWLNRAYAALGEDVIGGAEGLREAMHRLHPAGPVLIADEGASYRREFAWLFGADRIVPAETYRFDGTPVYRFFESFDWENLPGPRATWQPEMPMTPPLKPFLEEKLWLALYWMRPLREFWRRELGTRYQQDLDAIIPESWAVDPTPLPPHAVLPGLQVHSWDEVARFSQKERHLVLKISGFSPLAWGSRGVTIGPDVPQEVWAARLRDALESFSRSPYILQRYHKPRQIHHPVWDAASGRVREEPGRVRLCPFYIVEDDRPELRGALVTIAPADKKLIHGMNDAVLVPAARAPQSQAVPASARAASPARL